MKTSRRKLNSFEFAIFSSVLWVGLVSMGGFTAALACSWRDANNAKAAKQTLSKIPALTATGVKVDRANNVYVLLDKDGDKKADFAVSPKLRKSLNFEQLNGQSGDSWTDLLALETFHELDR